MTAVIDHPRWYNAEGRGETPLPISTIEFPTEDFKYADLEFVYPRTNWLVQRIANTAPITGRFKRVLIDIKVQDLHPDICSCIPGWHLDGSMQEVEVHHLCVLNGPQTEFIDEPLFLDREHRIPNEVKVRSAREGFITTFTSLDFHRGVYAAAPTRRLLVRLTETNIIQPRNKPHPPSQGAIR
jgi:hypothetical protein